MKEDHPELKCPECAVLMSFIRERTEVTIDGMRIFLWDYLCNRHGLWRYNPDTKELTQKGSSDFAVP